MKNFQKGFDPIVQFVQPGSHFEASNRQEGSPPFVSRGLYYTYSSYALTCLFAHAYIWCSIATQWNWLLVFLISI